MQDKRTVNGNHIRSSGVIAPLEREIFHALFAWLQASARVLDGHLVVDRKVTLLCTGWISGENFEIRQSVAEGLHLILPVHSLLPTRPVASGDVAEKDIVHHIRQSLGKGFTLTRTAPALSARVFHCSSALDRGTFEAVKKAKPIPLNSGLNLRPSIHIIEGPEIVRVTDSAVVINVRSRNRGELQCSLFEIPIHASIPELQAILMIPSERLILSQYLVDCQRKILRGSERNSLFRFSNLKPYCCYCAVVESANAPDSDSLAAIPLLAICKTFELANNPCTSFLLSSTSRMSSRYLFT